MHKPLTVSSFFFFNDTATTEIYTLSLHDALPISTTSPPPSYNFDESPTVHSRRPLWDLKHPDDPDWKYEGRSEEHTSELQSHLNLVCRLLLEKKKYSKNVGWGGSSDSMRSARLNT